MVGLSLEPDAARWWTMNAALVPAGRTVPAGLPGHFFTFNSEATFQKTPFVASFDGTEDAIVLLYKVVQQTTYAMGLAFTAPKGRAQFIDEAALMSTWKQPHGGIATCYFDPP